MAASVPDNGKIKVCVGLSGGVDSSVAALLLKEQGYDVFAMFMQNWHEADATLHGDCEWEEDRFVAELVARKIGIPFYFVDLSKEYRQRVVDYMFDEYAKGRTPNPDVLCNREIKFDAFLRIAEKYGADYVATGHYCRKEVLPDGTCRILEGTDPNKDQTYFLCQLTQDQLRKALFPIGDIVKPEVRRLAKEADLPSAEKKDSQGICFVGKVDLPTFLKQKLRSVEGEIIEVFDAWYADDDIVSYDFYSISHNDDVFLINKSGPIEFTIKTYEDSLGMRADFPTSISRVVPFFKRLNGEYLKIAEEPEGTIFFDLLIEQLERRADNIRSISIVYEELIGEDQSFSRSEFSYIEQNENYNESFEPEKNSLYSELSLYL